MRIMKATKPRRGRAMAHFIRAWAEAFAELFEVRRRPTKTSRCGTELMNTAASKRNGGKRP